MSFNSEISLDLKDFISATQTKNFILDDPIQDWLKYYGEQMLSNLIKMTIYSVILLKKKGLEFEKHVVKMLKNRHYFFEVKQNMSNNEKYNLTLEKMKEGFPLIKV